MLWLRDFKKVICIFVAEMSIGSWVAEWLKTREWPLRSYVRVLAAAR